MPALFRPTPDRWRQIENLFHLATQCDPPTRSAFLDSACGTDADLRNEVESLLAGLTASTPFLQSAIEDVAEAYIETQSPKPIAPGALLGRYRVIRLLGSGGMGEVYLAEDSRLMRKVAVKMLPSHLTRDAVALQRFEQEARSLSALNHANLLTVYELGYCESGHFLVTEFVEGETLRKVLDQARLPREKAVDIAAQIAAGLVAAHASGIIHRDIKPENLIIRADGWVKVLDFGIAKLAEQPRQPGSGSDAARDNPHTAAGMVLGTPRYMSPEQARGTGVDHRTDLFSLGEVFYEMLAGAPPFRGDTYHDLIADILRAEPARLSQAAPGTPRKLQAVVDRALAKDLSQRYPTAEAMLADLQLIRNNNKTKRSGRRLALSGVLALLLVMAAVTLFVTRRSWRGPEKATDFSQASPRSLAVLPFRNLKPDPETDFLGISLADEVIGKLGYVKALTVRPSSSINRYREGVPDFHKAAAELKASMLLTGTYLKDGDDLRITARLIGFNPDAVMWQNTLTVRYDKLLTVQDTVAKMIIQGLALRLGSDEQVRLTPDAPVQSLAYEYYLRGVDLYAASDFPAAITMLEKSVAIDANYAPTWAYLGRAYTTSGSLQFGGRDYYRRAEEAYDKAIAINPVFPDPRVYMANLFTDTGRVQEAVPLLRVALQSSPNNAEAHWELGYAYRYGGMLNASVQECELARRLDPEVKINSSAFNTYLYLGEYDRFLNSLPANDSPLLLFYHGFGSYYKGDLKVAAVDFDRAFELAPDLLHAQIGKALTEGIHHQSGRGITRLRNIELRMKSRGVTDPEAMYKVAQAYAVLGDHEDALRMLKDSIVGGFFCYAYIARDPLLNDLRGTQAFSAILEQARQRQEQFEKRFSR